MKIKIRRDTTANWQSANPILADGEIAVELMALGIKKLKVGDGTKRWNSLGYASGGAKGDPGLQGPTGATGAPGADGAQGPQGDPWKMYYGGMPVLLSDSDTFGGSTTNWSLNLSDKESAGVRIGPGVSFSSFQIDALGAAAPDSYVITSELRVFNSKATSIQVSFNPNLLSPGGGPYVMEGNLVTLAPNEGAIWAIRRGPDDSFAPGKYGFISLIARFSV